MMLFLAAIQEYSEHARATNILFSSFFLQTEFVRTLIYEKSILSFNSEQSGVVGK